MALLSRLKRAVSRQPNPETIPDGSIRFGPILIPPESVTTHFLTFGATGAGKTTMLRLMLQDIVPHIGQNKDWRLLMTNPKRDAMSILGGIAPTGVRVQTLDPFDARGLAWDIRRDVREPRTALQLTNTLFPRQQESQPFFRNASRHLLYGVLISFLRQGVQWTLADLIRATRTATTLKSILLSCDDTSHLVDQYFQDDRLLSNILSTLATLLLPFEPVAAAWESAKEKIAIEDWVNDESVLVLGSSEVSREAVDVINRCIFKRASDLVLDQSESNERRTFFLLDEVSECSKLDGLVSLLKRGRSKGASVVLAAQSIAGLRDPDLYGQFGAAEILGQIQNKFFGRLECPETAKWAAEVIGEQEIRQVTQSGSTSSGNGGGSSTKSWNEQFVTRSAVLASQLMSLTPCNEIEGLSAYYMTGITGTFHNTLDGQQLFGSDLIPSSRSVRDFVPRSIESQYLQPWPDERRAGFMKHEFLDSADSPEPKRPRLDLEEMGQI